MPEMSVEQLRERITDLRLRAGGGDKITLMEAAQQLGMDPEKLMAKLTLDGLTRTSGAIAVLPCMDGPVIIRRDGDEIAMRMPTALAELLVSGLLAGDPSADIKICAPLPAGTGSQEIQ